MRLNMDDYRKKVMGCWLGKNIGGTLGAPMEWLRQINNVEFYTEDYEGNPLPNDDLDLQLLWLFALEEKGIDINSRDLSEYWLQFLTPYWAEYGTSKINLRSGLVPPFSGTVNNRMKDSCGAFIRSEIWACIAPGLPEVAARYAYEDAIIDHGNGEGTYAEIFCAALESAAFIESDIYKLIEIGLSYIPKESGIALAVENAINSYKEGKTWLEARDEMLRKYCGSAFLGNTGNVSARDIEKGFINDKFGYDAPSNIGIIIIGLLYGGNDFGKSICTAVNCGEDTDCTAATLGSILGIINGSDGIPQKWIEPIGTSIKTGCLNLGELSSLGATGDFLPQNIEELTDRVIEVSKKVLMKHNKLCMEISEKDSTDLKDKNDDKLFASEKAREYFSDIRGAIYYSNVCNVCVEYINGPYKSPDSPYIIKYAIDNPDRIQSIINYKLYSPGDVSVMPHSKGQFFLYEKDPLYRTKELEFTIDTGDIEQNPIRLVLELSSQGRPGIMYVPVILFN
jgi:ADP-ribosylglycohydrolase